MSDHPVHDLEQLRERLARYQELDAVLGPVWLDRDYKQPFQKWSLITGWLNSDEVWALDWLEALNQTLHLLRGLPDRGWQTVRDKVSAHCPRNQFKSVLSELCVFAALFRAGCQLDFGRNLIAGSDLDADVTAHLPGSGAVVHLEVCQLNPSEGFLRELEVSGRYGQATPIDFDRERKRIRNKIWRKARKFPENELCLVAIDYTLFPEMGTGRFSLTEEVMGGSHELLVVDDGARLSSTRGPGGMWEREEMRRKLTGVLAFQIDRQTMQPVKCHAMIGTFAKDERTQGLVQFLEPLCPDISIYQPDNTP